MFGIDQAIAYGTTAVTLGLVLARPRIGMGLHVGPASAAAIGMLILTVTRVVTWADLSGSAQALWRPSLAILSIMVSTAAAERLRILDAVAQFVAPRPGQSVGRVFGVVFAVSAMTSAVLNNDAAVLLLTPLIVGMVRRAYPSRPDLVIPFAFAVFSAAGVAPLVISNPMNLIVAEYAGIGFNEYAARMIPVASAGWVTAYLALLVVFGRQLRRPNEDLPAPPVLRIRLSRPARQFMAMLLVGLACYPLLSYAGQPVWAVASAIAAVGVALCGKEGIASPRQLAADVSWPIIVFLFCVFVIVLGLRNVGFVSWIAGVYAGFSGRIARVAGIALVSALGSALLNNHPMAILNALALRSSSAGSLQPILAALIGGDLGPRLLPMGSLAGLLWLELLRKHAVHVSLLRFVAVGAAVTLPTIAVSVAILLLRDG